MPKISVIVPIYNVEKYLERCVSSILNQTFSDFEVLLINDASTDRSLEIARRFSGDGRVRVLDKSHSGLGNTRNYGVEHAGGDYLLFVDSDDWIDENMLKNLYAAAVEYQADLVLFNYVRENLQEGEQRICKLPVNYPELGEEIRELLIAELVGPDREDSAWRQVEMLGCAWRRMYLRSWYLENGIRFGDEREIMLEDMPAAIAAHCSARRLLVVGGAYYHYRYNPDSLSTRYRPRKMEMLTRCYSAVRTILTERGLYERYAKRHLAWFLRFAVHSSLVNCFSPNNPAGFFKRYREVRSILKNPYAKEAVRSDYLKNGNRADRVIRRVVRLRSALLAYLFYSIYSRVLMRDVRKK
ncbi:glycosyltransferase family 2 protein [Caproiciproducens sp. NJN-50]|uniref:glycosyltransferase family 2 protein n=1 Tax=Acutalibacteraceae TaxID=3082771 RepID=UPI000FFE2DE0|nr:MULTISPECIES: glycosyltransferase family 2 protein [Acutalibacteraceae]QAT49526.1 glycosyltransferase family 2 protein [Caproiciproducens sp. NJN-50]